MTDGIICWSFFGRILAGAAVGMALAYPAHAQHYNIVHVKRCDTVKGQGDAGIRDCYSRLADQAEQERQRVYARIVSVMTPSHAARLVTAERLWLQYRDAFCSAEHDLFDSGTAGLSAMPTCRLSLTRGISANSKMPLGGSWRSPDDRASARHGHARPSMPRNHDGARG